ncbi:MAG: 4Fe-4S dicluster domain-containing protein [Nitrospiraceae bacterium]|nr:MAG: 4Fe-4S dicluster domain-containing protein [Nitrospiraceae bacterium]
MIKLTIDNKIIEVAEGTTVLDAARMLNIEIPTLCHHPKLTPFGGCRLCIVEVKGVPRPLTSCTTPVSEGMEVVTSTPAIEDLRKTVLELILSDHPNDCMICEKAGDCALQELAYFYGIKENRLEGERRIYKKKDGNPFIERDMEKCILCGRCVKVCEEVEGVGAIDFTYRGFQSKICPTFEKDLDCEFCGQCIAVCPTGALTGKAWKQQGRIKDTRETETTCGYCGCGCSLTLHVRGNEVIKIDSREDTINEGWLCVKGRFGYTFINSPDRLKKPLIKRNGRFEEASWNEALDYIAERLKKIKKEHGPDSIAGLSSARCTNEENYLFQKFIRAAIGTNNVDHCARY